MSPENSYLDRLRFNAAYAQSIVGKYLKNFRLTLLLLIAILATGIVSYLNLPQRLNPEINIPIVLVTTVLPGASPQDIESLVTIPVEDQLNSLKGVDQLVSISQENVSTIQIQFVSGTDPKKAEQDVQSSINKLNDLPEDATDPVVKAFDFEDQPIWTFTVSSDLGVPSLMRFSDTLKKEIEKTANVDRVITSGYENEEVQIIISLEKIRQFGINPMQLAQSIKFASNSYPAGTISTDKNNLSLTIDPQITTIQDIRDLRITVNNQILRLSDIAEIQKRPVDNQTQSYLAYKDSPPKRVVTFNVYKTQGSDINKTSDDIKKAVNNVIKDKNTDYKITTIINTSDEIRKQFTDLLDEFRATIFLVFLCLFLFVGLRQAIISSFTVPLTFLSAFALMPLFGMSINFLTLFAFLLALGLLIDDTIVIVSGMTTYFRTGKFTAYETGILVWKGFIVPIWSTTITTIWSFIPLLLATGIIGEFIKPIPIVIGITMVSSTAIAVLITLPLMMIILKPNIPSRVVTLFKVLFFIIAVSILVILSPKNFMLPLIILSYFALLYVLIQIRGNLKSNHTLTDSTRSTPRMSKLRTFWRNAVKYVDQPILHLETVAAKYKSIIRRVLDSAKLRRTVLIAIITFALVSYLLLPLGLIKNEFFPKTNEDTIYMNIEYPAGLRNEELTKNALQVLDQLKNQPGTKFIVANVGSAVGGNGESNGTNSTVGFTLHLLEKEDRESSIELASALREKMRNYSQGKVSIVEVSGGPPAGADLQISLAGDDLALVDKYAQQIATYLKTRKGVTNIESSLKEGPSQIVFTPDKIELAKNKIGPETIGLWLRTFASGMEMDQIKFSDNGNEETKVILKFGYGNRTPEELSALTIPIAQNQLPLTSLGKLENQASPTRIVREDRKRRITVQASIVASQANTTEEGRALEEFASKLNLPSGYSWETGGVNEENAKSVNSIIQAMGVAFILILVTMVVQFGSFRQAFIALIVIPLAVSSVFFVFALTGTPLSFPALIGVLALFGIIVTNSMFIIDKINLNRKNGMPFKEAIADAGSSRLEPIVLTKLCTVLGLLPITLSQPLWRGLGGAIISGVLLASTFMLLFIPVVYYSLFRKEEEAKDIEGAV